MLYSHSAPERNNRFAVQLAVQCFSFVNHSVGFTHPPVRIPLLFGGPQEICIEADFRRGVPAASERVRGSPIVA